MPDVEGLNQQAYAMPELEYDQVAAEPVSLVDRMHNFFDSVVDRIENLTEALPVPSRRTALGMLGTLPLVGAAAPAIAETTTASVAKTRNTLIIPGQGIDGLKLGDTTAEVTKVFGGPISGPKDNLHGSVGSNGAGIVIELNTTSSRFKTSPGGLHIGEPLSAVPKAFPQAKRGSSPDGPDYSIAGTYRGKKVVTTFYTEHGSNVAEIEVSDNGDQQPPGFGLN